MIPDSIELSVIKIKEGEPVEVQKKYFYEFNFNAGNAFRRAEGLDYNQYMAKINDEEDQFEISEGVGKFFYYALEEGQRICGLEFDLSIEDVLRWVNKEAETSIFRVFRVAKYLKWYLYWRITLSSLRTTSPVARGARLIINPITIKLFFDVLVPG